MADQKLTQLTALATLSADDLFYVVDDPAGAATSHKLAASVLDGRYLQVANNLSDLANAGTARTNLGLAIGANVQAYDAFLASIAGLGTAADKMIYTTGVDAAAETGLSAFARSFLDDASEAAFKATVNLEIGVDVQAWDADLDTIAGLAKTDGNFIVGDGAAWVVESGATARTSLGLGSIATQAANSVSITGGSITGITDLAIADGGTGQSTAQAAIDALSNVAAATNEHVLTKDTVSGNAIFKAAAGGGGGAPVGATYIVQTPDGTLTNGQALSALATGLLKNTTTTGVLSIGVAGTDYPGLAFANVFTALQTVSQTGSGFVQLIKTTDDTAGAKPYISIKGPEGEFNIGNWGDAGRFWHTGGSVDSFVVLEDGRLVIGPGLSSFVRVAQFNNEVVGSKPYFEISSEAGKMDIGVWGNRGRFWMGGSDTELQVSQIDSSGLMYHYSQNATIAAVTNALQLIYSSSGTPAAGFGPGMRFAGKSSTTEDQGMARLAAIWDVATHASRSAALQILISGTSEVTAAQFDDDATAGNTRFLVYDVDNGQLERVSVGIADSGGVGFKLLRIVN